MQEELVGDLNFHLHCIKTTSHFHQHRCDHFFESMTHTFIICSLSGHAAPSTHRSVFSKMITNTKNLIFKISFSSTRKKGVGHLFMKGFYINAQDSIFLMTVRIFIMDSNNLNRNDETTVSMLVQRHFCIPEVKTVNAIPFFCRVCAPQIEWQGNSVFDQM